MSEFLKIADSQNGLVLLSADIVRLESKGPYTLIHCRGATTHIVSKNLKKLAEKLDPRMFFRVHRSHVINLTRVRCYERARGGSLLLEDGAIVPVAQRKKAAFLRIFRQKF